MSDNKLYLLLPSREEYTGYSDDELEHLVEELSRTLFLINHEEYDGFYCNQSLKAFYRYIKEIDTDLAGQLLRILEDWTPIADCCAEADDEYYVSGSGEGADPVVAAFFQSTAHSVVVSLYRSGAPLVLKQISSHVPVATAATVPCTEKAVYDWFYKYRHPQRELHPEYKKHSQFGERIGKKGVVVSAFTYSDEDAFKYLCLAVGTSSYKRLVYHKADNHHLLIFFKQDHTCDAFHALQTDENNNAEIQKLGNTALKKLKRLKALGYT